MARRFFLLVGVVVILLGLLSNSVCLADGDVCVELVSTYNRCVETNPLGYFNESFQNFDERFEYIKNIYTQIFACNLTNWQDTAFCTCLFSSDLLSYLPWITIFTNPSYYNSLKQLVSDIRKDLGMVDEDILILQNNSTYEYFCHATTWDYDYLRKLADTSVSQCVEANNDRYFAYSICNKRYDSQTSDVLIFEKIVRCVIMSVSRCDPNLDILFVIGQLLPNPNIIKGDLIDYSKRMLDTENQVNRNRKTVFMFGDPHLQDYGSNDIIKTCSIRDKILLLKTSQFEIFGVGVTTKAPEGHTFLNSLQIVFTLTSGNYEYEASQSGLPSSFSNGATFISDSKDSFELISLEYDTILIYAKEISTHIIVNSFQFDDMTPYQIFVRSTDQLFQSSTGILVDGCPQHLITDDNQISDIEDDSCYYNCKSFQAVTDPRIIDLFTILCTFALLIAKLKERTV